LPWLLKAAGLDALANLVLPLILTQLLAALAILLLHVAGVAALAFAESCLQWHIGASNPRGVNEQLCSQQTVSSVD
jgi:hypothetical protein